MSKKEGSQRIEVRLLSNIRKCIWQACGGKPGYLTTLKSLGCSVKYLKAYIADKLRQNMTWDNYGKWHIDHIKPCSSFDLSKPEQQRRCFHYSNLQPLWAKDNLSKGENE